MSSRTYGHVQVAICSLHGGVLGMQVDRGSIGEVIAEQGVGEDVARAAASKQQPFGHRVKEGTISPRRDAGADEQSTHTPVPKEPEPAKDQVVEQRDDSVAQQGNKAARHSFEEREKRGDQPAERSAFNSLGDPEDGRRREREDCQRRGEEDDKGFLFQEVVSQLGPESSAVAFARYRCGSAARRPSRNHLVMFLFMRQILAGWERKRTI